MKKMIKLWMVTCLQLAELCVSSLVHLLYGFYIFSSAVAGDISQKLNDYLFKSNADINETDQNQSNVEGLPPIVLVHGIFGFGKGEVLKEGKGDWNCILVGYPNKYSMLSDSTNEVFLRNIGHGYNLE